MLDIFSSPTIACLFAACSINGLLVSEAPKKSFVLITLGKHHHLILLLQLRAPKRTRAALQMALITHSSPAGAFPVPPCSTQHLSQALPKPVVICPLPFASLDPSPQSRLPSQDRLPNYICPIGNLGGGSESPAEGTLPACSWGWQWRLLPSLGYGSPQAW